MRIGERTMMSRRDPQRRAESGQVMVLFILILMTLLMLALVAIAVGQVLVRRHQAQAIVDAAALSGAASQARGLNTLARWNEKELNLLRGLQFANFLPFVDNSSTTELRFWTGGFSILINDWAGDVLREYTSAFDTINAFKDVVNLAFSPASFAPFAPRAEAESVIEANFVDDSTIFTQEDLADYGYLPDAERLLSDPSSALRLVKLTEPEEHYIAPYYYAFWPTHWSLQTCPLIPPADVPCLRLLEVYGIEMPLAVELKLFLNPIKYEVGKFYDNRAGNDVRFAYFLKVAQTPVIFGKEIFNDLPDIVVAAAAKPWDGYLGDDYEAWIESSVFTTVYSTPSGKDISYTYKAKLVPLTRGEIETLVVRSGDPASTRWLTVMH